MVIPGMRAIVMVGLETFQRPTSAGEDATVLSILILAAHGAGDYASTDPHAVVAAGVIDAAHGKPGTIGQKGRVREAFEALGVEVPT